MIDINWPFEMFPKVSRLFKDIVITEKIDGTNAQIFIQGDKVYAGSRTKRIYPMSDNFGFAAWVEEHKEELLGLGEGRHFGEWWGKGIQRGYNGNQRRFSLFNTSLWQGADYTNHVREEYEPPTKLVPPTCCSVVPVLYSGPFSMEMIEYSMENLRKDGSVAAPGYMNPEGIMIFHVPSNSMFKHTFNDTAKGAMHGNCS